jgi:hypothetical protein
VRVERENERDRGNVKKSFGRLGDSMRVDQDLHLSTRPIHIGLMAPSDTGTHVLITAIDHYCTY